VNKDLSPTPLRLWPGVAAAAAGWLAWYLIPVLFPENAVFGMLGGILGGFLVIAWWLFFSRAPWLERVGALVLMVVAMAVTSRLVHESISGAGMGRLLFIYSIPVMGLALVAATVATRHLSREWRRAAIAAAILLACGGFTIVRTGGITGEADSDLHWRWTPTPEERLLAQAEPAPLPPAAPAAAATPENPSPAPAAASPAAPENAPEKIAAPAAVKVTTGEWPGFRGPRRDGVVRGVRIETDWSTKPPVELWRRPIGPGWSSFAVEGDRLYTQEQRGDDEIVSAYNLTTGEPVWRHRDAARFWESNGGAGPRGTPTLSGGTVYALGATGLLNALDAGTGAVVWSRNAQADTGAALPGWGFAGSPLVMDDTVIVATSGRLVAYDRVTGNPRWVRRTVGGGYSSPQLVMLDGVEQIVLLSGGGATAVSPADGTVLWEHKWPGAATSIQQPTLTADGVLITGIDASALAAGTRRIAVTHGEGGWTVDERWTTNALKPYFNDLVVHKGQAFGFDGSILASINLEDGTRAWKGGRYGHGQLVLLPEQDLLLVLSEEGEVALVGATPGSFVEHARFKAIEGKTWNHPVLVGDILLVRNGEEMAAFRLAMAAP
jgi:outer membrane protein assembly factor BamB